MSPESVALIIGIMNLLGLLYLGLIRHAKTEARVDVLWQFLMRQGISSAVLGGIAERNSPIRLNRAVFDNTDLPQKLRAWYGPKQQNLNNFDLFVGLEKSFSEDFTKFCEQRHLMPGACVAAAMLLLRPSAYDQFRVDASGDKTDADGIQQDRRGTD